MSDGTDLLEHMNFFNKLISQLRSVDVKVEEEDQALILLSSLPKSFDHLVTTILYGKDTLKMEEVKYTLLSNEARTKSSGSSSESLMVKSSGQDRGRQKHKSGKQNRSRSKSRVKDNTCHYCKEEGHWKADCPKLKEKIKRKQKEHVEASVVSDSEKEGEVLTVSSGMDFSDDWILVYGCSYHMCPHREWFESYASHDGRIVPMGNNNECRAVGIGNIKIKMFDGVIRILTEVRHVPELRNGLISLGTLDASGCTFHGANGILKVSKGALTVMKGERTGTLYRLHGKIVTGNAAITSSSDNDATLLWYARLGHMSERGMLELHKKKLLKDVQSCKLDFCECCVLGKQCRVKFVTSRHRSKDILEYVHSDVWGAAPVTSLGGARYFVTFIDDFSRKVWVYFLKHKSEVFEKFKDWKTNVEKQTGKHVKVLRTDNGGEYTSK
uniref:Retrovirus-related Pol polyprotein from transposon TNT 1-94 n=1 Tax=Anthurium amnicola TaxID=1678845 RepID=A0A1D1Z793_9ARAE